jgi:glutamyl-tRNA synthetase
MREEQKAKKEAPKYDRQCLNLSKEEIKKRLDKKESYVVRLKIPDGITEFKDIIRGKISIKNEVLDDQVILKSDGFPTYHLAVVVDDHLMRISHVIRAEEWLPSTPKHILLYQALKWDVPQFAHLPMILGDDKKKLSKRHGSVAFLEYKKQGYLPEALINFMVFLGWNPKDEREVFSLKELIKEFDLEKVNKAGAVFNIEKLDNINSQYIRKLDADELVNKCIPYLEKEFIKKIDDKIWKINETGEMVDKDWLKKVILLEQERMKKFSEIGDLTAFFFKKDLKYKADLLIWRKSDQNKTLDNLKILEDYLDKLDNWDKKDLEEKTINWLKENKYGIGDFLWPLRVALSGEKASPGPFEIADIFGKKISLEKIKASIEKLGRM